MDGVNIAQVEELVRIATAAGLPADEARTVLAKRSCAAAVEADWQWAMDLRITAVPTQPTQSNRGLDQWRLYADLELIADRLGLVLDETLAPGKATRQEAYVRATTAGMGLYLKAGQFYLPFGWRLQDGSAYVRSVSGIGMSAPDKGVEFGLEQGPWSAQLE